MPAASPRRRFSGLPGPVSKPIAEKLPNGDKLPAISMGCGAGCRYSERVEKPFSPGESGLVHHARDSNAGICTSGAFGGASQAGPDSSDSLARSRQGTRCRLPYRR